MKYLLIMQIIFDGSRAGGAGIDSVKFESLTDCEKAKAAYMVEMKDKRPYGLIFRKAECVKIGE